MSWEKVFMFIGIVATFLMSIRVLYPCYSFIAVEIFKIRKKRLIEKVEKLNSPGARASLGLRLYELEKMIPEDIDWEKQYKTMFMIMIMSSIGLILAHFGISGKGGLFYDD